MLRSRSAGACLASSFVRSGPNSLPASFIFRGTRSSVTGPSAPAPPEVARSAEVDPLIAIAGGGGVGLFNSQGNSWTADYLKITGELDVDLRSNIAAESRAKIVTRLPFPVTSRPTIQFGDREIRTSRRS